MGETKELVVRKDLSPSDWEMIRNVAPAMLASRLFKIASQEQAMAIMLKGYELGLGLAASFEFIHVVQGKPGLSPRGALALIIQHPEFDGLDVEDSTDDNGEPIGCTVRMNRKNGIKYEVSFTIEDAKRAGIHKPNSAWEKYPANMCRWRAVGFCADVVFPDIMGGLKRTDELGADITQSGDTIDGTWTVQSFTAEQRLEADNIRSRFDEDTPNFKIASEIASEMGLSLPQANSLLKSLDERTF